LRAKYLANDNLPPQNEPHHKGHYANPFYPRFWPERLKELPKGTPKGIFVCNMCEFFGDWVPANWQKEIFKVIRANPQHRFYFLTKRPHNLAKFSPFPDNCWLGATVCDKRMAWNAWWYYFGPVRAKLKFISFEPLLEDLMELPGTFPGSIIPKADWIIIGSQTKPYNPPKIEWVQALVEIADKAGVPVFLKDNLKPLLDNNLRQEFPERKHPPGLPP
jgi:protein gp37